MGDLFGLDISPSSIKLIQAQKTASGHLLKAFGETTININLNSELERDQMLAAAAIKKLVEDSRVITRNVVIALPESQVYSRVIELPPLQEDELAKAMRFEAEQYVPIPLDQVQIQHTILKSPPKGSESAKMEVLLVAAQQKAIETLEKIVIVAGLTPVSLETELLAILRAISPQMDSTAVLIDLGQNSTDLAIVIDGVLKQVYTIASGGAALTRAIAANLSLNVLQAEQYKRTYGLDKTQLEGKVAEAILDPLEIIVNQIKNSLSFIKQKYPETALRKTVITGGTALLPDLSVYLADKLGLEVLLGDPFYAFIRDKNFPEPLVRNAPRFATAVGLAIRES